MPKSEDSAPSKKKKKASSKTRKPSDAKSTTKRESPIQTKSPSSEIKPFIEAIELERADNETIMNLLLRCAAILSARRSSKFQTFRTTSHSPDPCYLPPSGTTDDVTVYDGDNEYTSTLSEVRKANIKACDP